MAQWLWQECWCGHGSSEGAAMASVVVRVWHGHHCAEGADAMALVRVLVQPSHDYDGVIAVEVRVLV